MGKCFVTGCTSGYKSNKQKVSIFKAPNDPVLLQKWQRAIPLASRALRSKDHVCEKHFSADEVIKDWKAEMNGVVIMQVPRKAKLAKDAVPCKFPGPSYLSKEIRHRKPPAVRSLEFVSRTKKPRPPRPTVTAEIATCSVQHVPEIEPPKQVNMCFNYLRENVKNVELPNSMWSANVVDPRVGLKSIAFICVGIHCENRRMIILKQVCLDEKLNVSVFVLNTAVTPPQLGLGDQFTVINIEDINLIIRALHGRYLCVGGPSIREYVGVRPETAYMDDWGKWRHKRCTLLSETMIQCKPCASVDGTLRNQMARKRKRTVTQRIRMPLSPTEKAGVNILRKPKTRQAQSLKKQMLLSQQLKDTIKDLQEKISKVNETTRLIVYKD